MLKHCVTCKQDKPFDATVPNSRKARGFYGLRCWDCYCKDEAMRKLDQYTKEEKAVIAARHYAKVVSPQYLAVENERAKLWAKQNPAVANAKTARRRAGRTQRTPVWANHDVIKLHYIYAKALNLTVDHVIPLHGELVSGLHVENNLQLLTRTENSSKGAMWP
jgi:5-methylcytosine-specific restriction endonuclease McrA